MIRALVLSLIASLAVSGAAPLWAAVDQDPAEIARRASRDLAVALASLDQADKASDRVAALTQTIHAYENGLTAFREAMRRAAIRKRTVALSLEGKRERIERLVSVMMTMKPQSAPLLLLHPSGPLGTARSGMMLSEITPALQAEAAGLRQQLDELSVLSALQASATTTLEQSLAGLQLARTKLSQAISDRTDLPRRVIDDPAQMRALVASAETLKAFASGLTESDSDGVASFTDMRGALRLPVIGTVLRGFNEADAAGVRRPGLVIAAQPRALVSTPWPSTIRYAGPLLDYGNVMILEPAGGYLLVLAGLAEVYGKTGQVIPADTPVGLMGGEDTSVDAFLTQAAEGSGAQQSETLYIEMRVGSEPVDPSQWFALNKE